MCLRNTDGPVRHGRALSAAVVAVLVGASLAAQVPTRLDWRPIGNTAIDLALSAVASGPVERVWYSADGSQLFVRTGSARVFTTSDFETWAEAAAVEPPAPVEAGAVPRAPEAAVRTRAAGARNPKLYAFGRYAYRSEDGGLSWANLTGFRNTSLLGDGLSDLAVSPRDADDIAVAGNTGVWRSVDGGLSWTGLNAGLPNLRARRILSVPAGMAGARIAVAGPGGSAAWEWNPGEKQAWRQSSNQDLQLEADLKRVLGASLRAALTAVTIAGDYIYAGSSDGQIWASADRGRTWTRSPDAFSYAIERIWVDPREPRLALAALGDAASGAAANAKPGRVLRTVNGGGFWDDLSADLPNAPVHGVTGDRATGAIYAATAKGLYITLGTLINAGPATPWVRIGEGLPDTAAKDVALDAAGNQLYVAFDDYGLFAAPAPHRFREPRVVSAADFTSRPAAPGTLLSVLGANLRAARSGQAALPVLAAGDGKTEIQVPFDVSGTSLPLSLESPAGSLSQSIPLRPTSPAIFVDRDGTPMLLEGDSGVLLDAMTTAKSGGRIQVLATGLGRVRPDWPAGTPAPADNSPRVVASVKAYLDREPVEVTRAILAPGYVGFYLVEIQLPRIVNAGPAELYIDADGQQSNRVRVYIEP